MNVRHRLPMMLLAIVASLGCLLAAGQRADAYVYWANLGGFGSGEIGRANLNGSGKDRKFIRDAIGPVAITVDRRHAFWINGDGDSIGRARLDGTKVDQNFITGVGFARDLVVAGGHIYWTRGETIGAVASIARAALDGTDVERKFIAFDDPASFSTPTELQVQGGYMYWTNAYPTYTIARARLDGSEVNQTFIAGGLKNPFGLAVDDSHVYWSNRGTRSISRARLDGTGVELDFIADVGRVSSVALDDRFLYWPGPRDGIFRARLNGSRVKALIARGAPAISVAVDGRGPD